MRHWDSLMKINEMRKELTIAVNDDGLLNQLVTNDCQSVDVQLLDDDCIWWFPKNKKTLKIVVEYYINLYFK